MERESHHLSKKKSRMHGALPPFLYVFKAWCMINLFDNFIRFISLYGSTGQCGRVTFHLFLNNVCRHLVGFLKEANFTLSYIYYRYTEQPDSLQAGRFGNRTPLEARFSTHVHTGPGNDPFFSKTGILSFPRVKRPGRGVALTIHSPIYRRG